MQPTQRRVPSPAIILALVALTFALAGTALAGPNVSKITKSKVRTIADKEVEKLAPDLSVAKADKATTADTATTATGVGAGSGGHSRAEADNQRPGDQRGGAERQHRQRLHPVPGGDAGDRWRRRRVGSVHVHDPDPDER
jgi:hypothetical protein